MRCARRSMISAAVSLGSAALAGASMDAMGLGAIGLGSIDCGRIVSGYLFQLGSGREAFPQKACRKGAERTPSRGARRPRHGSRPLGSRERLLPRLSIGQSDKI
ncbi:hypothetical protein FRZ61_27380 [Hypericibacter adhaerens]|uniref:Uncharacterized protein n=1 Tax=Hypericibacter adhaerens TaxID=2602016 RepID=A0A5J6N723_9PROT|nr:hypothetical protein FRZ61_27380 [Hypericibacter adhaerens]